MWEEGEEVLLGSSFADFAWELSGSMFVFMGVGKLGKFRCPSVVENVNLLFTGQLGSWVHSDFPVSFLQDAHVPIASVSMLYDSFLVLWTLWNHTQFKKLETLIQCLSELLWLIKFLKDVQWFHFQHLKGWKVPWQSPHDPECAGWLLEIRL